MRSARRLISALIMAGLVAGCAGTSHAATGRPSQPVATAAQTSPIAIAEPATAAQTAATANMQPASTAPWARPPARQRGIDLDFYSWQGIDVAQYLGADIAYVKSLHANALSVSFPFFVHGPRANSVYGTVATPTPAELATIAAAAKAAGLYFSIRAVLDDANLHPSASRVHWAPPNQGAWFASYEKFLRPYAQMAQRQRIPEFIVGVELSKFNNSPYWARLATYLRSYYKGTLAYSNNWEQPVTSRISHGLVQSLDAYPPIKVPASASIARLTSGWDAYLKQRFRGVVITEVGIASQDGAYTAPWVWSWPGKPLDPKIQFRWFTAACNAVVNEKAAGLYFWSIGIGNQFSSPPTLSNPGAFVDGSGAHAISTCFSRLSR